MDRDLEKQNQALKAKINQLKEQISSYGKKQNEQQEVENLKQTNDYTQTEQKKCSSQIDFSPIQTCESLRDETISIDMQIKRQIEVATFTVLNRNQDKVFQSQMHSNSVKFNLQDRMEFSSNVANSDLSKQLQMTEHKLKKSVESISQVEQVKTKNFYNSAIKQRNHCEDCISRMHQLHEMQFLKNKYHRQYIALRAQLDKVKTEMHENQGFQTPRSSINLIDIYGQHNNQERSQKSSFSFENIQNTLLSERFALQIEECIKLIDKLLPLDRKFIELSAGDYKLLMELQVKIENLKFHLGLDTEPKYLEDLFSQLEKTDLSIKKIHERYRKLFDKIFKTHKEKLKRSKDQFNQVNQMLVIILKDLHDTKIKYQKLSVEAQMFKTHSFDVKETKCQSLSSSNDLKQLKGTKDSANHEIFTIKEKDLHETTLSQFEKSSTFSESKMQKQIEKCQSKLKNSEKQNKNLQKIIKQLKSQLSSIKKKSLNDFNQFMNAIIFNAYSKLRNTFQQTDNREIQQDNQFYSEQSEKSQSGLKVIRGLSSKRLIEEIGSLVYEIFSFTSWQNDEDENIFLPQTQEQILQMLTHIKKFASKFDEWQKDKEKQINGFQRNFLQLLKFFIDNYKISELKLIEEISKMKDNQPLVLYIKKYYSKSIQLIDPEDRDSSSFTFGQKSLSCKDSEVQP